MEQLSDSNPEDLALDAFVKDLQQEYGVLQAPPRGTPAKERLVIGVSVHHQAIGDPPTTFHNSGFRVIENTGEQAYSRRQVAESSDWTEIEFGWLKDRTVSLFVIHNLEGTNAGVIAPVEEMRLGPQAKIMELGVSSRETEPDQQMIFDTGILILPGEAIPISPQRGRQWFIRCPNGPARFNLVAFPG